MPSRDVRGRVCCEETGADPAAETRTAGSAGACSGSEVRPGRRSHRAIRSVFRERPERARSRTSRDGEDRVRPLA